MMLPAPFYHDNTVTLYNADCLKLSDEKLGLQADMLLTDPPYGCTAQEWDKRLDWSKFWAMVLLRSKETAPIMFTINALGLAEAITTSPISFCGAWHWRKNKGTNHLNKDKQPLRVIEHIPIFCNVPPVYNPQMWQSEPQNYAFKKGFSKVYGRETACESRTGETSRYPINVLEDFPEIVIDCPVVNNDDPNRIHSNQKPVELFEYLIRTHSNIGDTIFDPFAGSGTTAIAARNTGRKCVLIEKSKNDCEKIVARLNGEKPHLRPKGILTIDDFLKHEEEEHDSGKGASYENTCNQG